MTEPTISYQSATTSSQIGSNGCPESVECEHEAALGQAEERAERLQARLNATEWDAQANLIHAQRRQLDSVRTRAEDAEARIAAVRAEHATEFGNEYGGLECSTCREVWPCPTVAALDGPADTPAAVFALPVDVVGALVRIARHVSAGRAAVAVQEPYPDTVARWTLGQLDDAGLLAQLDGHTCPDGEPCPAHDELAGTPARPAAASSHESRIWEDDAEWNVSCTDCDEAEYDIGSKHDAQLWAESHAESQADAGPGAS